MLAFLLFFKFIYHLVIHDSVVWKSEGTYS
jgi:hypothetical protein